MGKITPTQGKIIKDDNKGNKNINFSINSNHKSRKRKNSYQKSSELILFMKNEESNGISLYTHITNLLDMFIFQNPVQPVKYFEYYSEKLKKYYNKSHPDSDLDFLNNIEKNMIEKIMDIYKDNKIINKGNSFFEDRESNFSNVEETGYEGENEYEDNFKNEEEPNETKVQDLSKINHMFNKAGCGLTNDEVMLIGITMDQMSRSEKFKTIRYWGKIFGLKQNYYVLECEWRNEELQLRLRYYNKIMNKNNYDNEDIYKNKEEVESEINSLYEECYEQMEQGAFFPSLLNLNNNTNEQSTYEPNLSFPFLHTEQNKDNSSGEIFGFGANKMSYFVANKLSEEWIELPLLKPHHIIQSRNIKQYFVGDLESHVKSYPIFQGLEKHYLRAQIARISAGTHVSPRDYFIYYNNNIKSYKWEKLNTFQSKALSLKWVHNYVINENYNPPPVYDLLKPNNWVHHTPLISREGVTHAWTKLSQVKNSVGGETASDEQIAEQNVKNDSTTFDQYNEYPDLFVPLSEDINVAGKISPWKLELTYPFDHKNAYVTIKSNLWPGAFAVTCHKLSDYTYYGWGHKLNINSYVPLTFSEYQSEYPNNTAEITEMGDPSTTDELQFYENVQKIKEENKNRRFAIHLPPMNEEEEEKILNHYSYD